MKFINALTCLGLLLSTNAHAYIENEEFAEIIICLPSHENITLKVNPSDTFYDICLQAEMLSQNETSKNDHKKVFLFDYRCGGEAQISARNYDLKLTKKERQDIGFIVTTLGRSSLKKIWDAESSLKKAGDRVDLVHPFRFIACIFEQEELKVGLLQVRERTGLISKKFFNGLFDSLSKEADLGNLKEEYIIDFAANLKIDPAAIRGVIQARDWKGLIDALITLLPRSGNPNRYDM